MGFVQEARCHRILGQLDGACRFNRAASRDCTTVRSHQLEKRYVLIRLIKEACNLQSGQIDKKSAQCQLNIEAILLSVDGNGLVIAF
jgi:hypothetical protein